MNPILSLFPADNFSLISIILGMPLLGALVNGIWGRRLGKQAVSLMALSAVGVSLLACMAAFWSLDSLASSRHGEHVKLSWTAWEWMHTTGGRWMDAKPLDVPVAIDLRFSIDALSGVMMLVVTGVGFLIHLYSTAYMAEDKAYWRFFAYLNLFVFSMLLLILGDNLPVLFVGWEGVGLCSYLLIGFWYTKLPNAQAGKKAFIANRIGDFGLICAMFLLARYTGALDWIGMEKGATALISTSDSAVVHIWPLGGSQLAGWLQFLQPTHPFVITAATAAGFMLLLGCTGKSAQIPLYVWLPDAMAGPTPVSALIHAATMVTAGVYLVCRMSFVFTMSPLVMMTIAGVGAATAFFAATIALVQNDIKKVLAYSTVSQLGFMFLGVGVGAFAAGFFHVFTHAFFKACLFLGAGSVIHAMHARIHDDDKSQDMRNMGGLRQYMPFTFWTFAAATAAIIGLPFLTSGFYSKDEILFRAWTNYVVNPAATELAQRRNLPFDMRFVWESGSLFNKAVYFMAVAAATMTAFYMCRALFLTFFGEFRGWTVGRASHPSHPEHHDEHGHHDEDLTVPGPAPHESPWQMTVPLIILGALSIFAAVLNPTFLEALHIDFAPLNHWLEPVFKHVTEVAVRPSEAPHAGQIWALGAGGMLAFAVGTGLSYWMYIREGGAPAKQLAESFPRLHEWALAKWKVDEAYDVIVTGPVDALADTAVAIDKGVVDGLLARFSSLLVAVLGTILRAFQNGVVHAYAAIMVVGMAGLGWFFVTPHAEASTTTTGNGDFVLQAAPGVGYAYKWYPDANGKPLSEQFTKQTELKVHLEPGGSQTVKLEVTNAFGLTGYTLFPLTRAGTDSKPIQVGQN